MVGSAGPRFAIANSDIWGNHLVAELGVQTLQSSLPACLKTPVLQTGSRITSRELVAGVGVAPTEAELMRLA